ncbi:hypothetical protein CDCA_CDCA12G3418 [Cyanidium caldarium]|uniref:Uncharacterized protein n=1 Tax=Cyanidium caldarium TaxID=2771 RepID=A0AAV9J054_CYACA|nr:hypothetical protein CDCA_CDCA12G3418 [Cyanidium caldarium]
MSGSGDGSVDGMKGGGVRTDGEEGHASNSRVLCRSSRKGVGTALLATSQSNSELQRVRGLPQPAPSEEETWVDDSERHATPHLSETLRRCNSFGCVEEALNGRTAAMADGLPPLPTHADDAGVSEWDLLSTDPTVLAPVDGVPREDTGYQSGSESLGGDSVPSSPRRDAVPPLPPAAVARLRREASRGRRARGRRSGRSLTRSNSLDSLHEVDGRVFSAASLREQFLPRFQRLVMLQRSRPPERTVDKSSARVEALRRHRRRRLERERQRSLAAAAAAAVAETEAPFTPPQTFCSEPELVRAKADAIAVTAATTPTPSDLDDRWEWERQKAPRAVVAVRTLVRSAVYCSYETLCFLGHKDLGRALKLLLEAMVDEAMPPRRLTALRKVLEYLVPCACGSYLLWYLQMRRLQRGRTPVYVSPYPHWTHVRTWRPALFTVAYRVLRLAVIYRFFLKLGTPLYRAATALAIVLSFFRAEVLRELFRIDRWPQYLSAAQGLRTIFRSVVYAAAFSIPLEQYSPVFAVSRRRANVRKAIFFAATIGGVHVRAAWQRVVERLRAMWRKHGAPSLWRLYPLLHSL